MKNHFPLILIGAALVSSCYSDEVVELPENKPLVTVNSINFEPDSNLLIELTKSVSFYYSSGHLYIENAEIHIEDEEGAIIQLKPIVREYRTVYTSDQRPVENKQYKLVVDAPGFPITKAVSKIPKPVPILNLEIDSAYFLEQKQALLLNPDHVVDFSKAMQCKLIFNDPPNEANYYDVRLYVEGRFDFTNSEGGTETIIRYYEYPLVDLETTTAVSMLRDDTKFNGLQYGLQFNIPFHLLFSPIGNLHIVLTSLNSDRYKYLQTVKLQDLNKYDPFAQPVLIHNNIENGVGIFAGLSKSVWVLEEPDLDD